MDFLHASVPASLSFAGSGRQFCFTWNSILRPLPRGWLRPGEDFAVTVWKAEEAGTYAEDSDFEESDYEDEDDEGDEDDDA